MELTIGNGEVPDESTGKTLSLNWGLFSLGSVEEELGAAIVAGKTQ